MSNRNVELMQGEPEIAIRKLAIPIMISMLLTASYNIIDGIWVVGLGQSAIAGIGFVTPIFLILNGISNGIGSGATSRIARYVGSKDHEKVSKTATQSLFLILVASILLTITILLIQNPILRLFGATGETLTQSLNYSTPLFLGLAGIMFSNGCSGILRGEGDMKRAMYATIVSVMLNAILDPLLIYFLNLGVMGAALATILSSVLSATVILYWILIKKDTYAQIRLKNFKIDSEIQKDILKVGIPTSFEIVVIYAAMSIHLIIIAMVGGDFGVASFTSGHKFYSLAILPFTAIGSSVIAVVGSSYGAKNGDFISRAHMYGVKFGVVFGIIITLILTIFSNQLAVIFAYTPETQHLIPGIALYLQVACLCLPFTGAGMTSSFFYQGIGKGSISLFFSILKELIFIVPFIYILGVMMNMGLLGVWIGMAGGRSLACILNFIFARFEIKKIRKEIGS
ncbi:MATE family efflux transporter [Methanobrevibacter sp.]